MSIEAMIAEHPQVKDDYNQALGRAVKTSMNCAAICNSCADACLAEFLGPEPMDMSQCIRLNLDCADICLATSRIATRRTGHDVQLIRTMLKACIAACQRCGAECGRHEMAHCQRCALMCNECVEDCLYAISSLDPGEAD
ncbi:MAG: four-helix bundle copper-binding protein [Sphingomonadales bacterium]|nr:four-helix bundle copper-binding protein [Sphingomonadales bacterium]